MNWWEIAQWVVLAYCVWGIGYGLKELAGVIEHLERRVHDLQTRMDEMA